MTLQKNKTGFLLLSVAQITAIATASLGGILNTSQYAAETANWRIQALAQDYFDLLVLVPVLIAGTILVLKKSIQGTLLWTGAMVYSIYTFIIYSFSVHFNSFFLVYCAALGLSVYLLLLFFIWSDRNAIRSIKPRKLISRISSAYLIVMSVLFLILWLADITAAMREGKVPQALIDSGIPTNPVHVNDIALLLPAMFIAGWNLWKGNVTGRVMAPALLFFSGLMSLTIAGIFYGLYENGLASDPGMIWVMILQSMVSLVLMTGLIRITEKDNAI